VAESRGPDVRRKVPANRRLRDDLVCGRTN
jgi:hypothetical protein